MYSGSPTFLRGSEPADSINYLYIDSNEIPGSKQTGESGYATGFRTQIAALAQGWQTGMKACNPIY